MTTTAMQTTKFSARYSLGLFLLSNWLYNELVTGPNGIANFDSVPSDVFTDRLFYLGAFKQLKDRLSANIEDESICKEMMESKSFLLSKAYLKLVSNLNEEGMAKMIEEGYGVYELMLGKKLAENIIFDDDVMPTSYTTLDGSDTTANEATIPMHLVFSMDSDTLTKMENLLDLSNTTIVKSVITELQKDIKFRSFTTTFDLLYRLEKA